jgi:cystathionine beta-lyase
MAAIDAITRLLNPGDEVIATADIYGGSYRLFTKVVERYGIKFHFVDLSNPENIKQYINEKTKMIWLETPTNPSLQIIDIKGIKHFTPTQITIVVDNTFASPYLQNPLELGADIVIHSGTKYLGGHSDVISGCVMLNDKKMAEEIKFIQKSVGGVPGPMDVFLVMRGIKTLAVRMERHCDNAEKIADFLVNHPKVAKVNYPGLQNHPNHLIAKSQMKRYGGMMSFELKDDSKEAAVSFLKKCKLFSLAESLGGVESLISHPASMTHASIPKEERQKAGISDSLIRISVGIEDIEDLLAELTSALA